jgi:NAD dependent epimerase/dehydratase family enzyme
VPSFILNFILGEMAVIVLKGVNVSNEKLIDSGFEFKYSDLETTFKAIYSKNL